jgi:thymidylate kinase
VQKRNYTLLLKCSAEVVLQRAERSGYRAGDEPDVAKTLQTFQTQNADVENHLKAAEGFFKEVREDRARTKLGTDFISQINGDGSTADVHHEVTQAVEGFMQRAKEGL